jgi:RNA polymerase sigma-70 factor (ECF subfamily)
MAAESPSDADVSAAVVRAQQGDADAFRVLYRAVHPRLYRYLVVLLGPDAQDVAGEVWSRIATELGSFHGGVGDFRGWVATIARQRALDHARQGRRRPVAPVPERVARRDSAAIEVMSTDAALALIAALPPDQAEAVVLAVVFGLDARSAGAVLGKRPSAVRTAVHRGLRTLAGRV